MTNSHKIVNCTPHPVTVAGVTIPPSGMKPRVETFSTWVENIQFEGVEIPLVKVRNGAVVGIPEAKPGVLYVVSRMVAEAAPDRSDLVVPWELARDDQGRIIGCEGLARI